MTFGKRRPFQAATKPAAPTTNSSVTANPTTASPWKSGLGMVGWFLAGIVTVALACELLLGLGKVANQRLDDRFKYVGTLPPTLALLKTSTAEGQHLKGCVLARPVEVTDSFQNNRFGRRDRFGSDIATETADQSHFLQCIAEAGSALCDSEIRGAFAQDVQKFLTEYAALTSHMTAFKSDPEFEKVFSHIQSELSKAHPRDAPNLEGQRSAARDTMIEARARVFEAVTTAAASGLITARDFGLFGNREIKKAISTTSVTQSQCSN